MAVYTAQSIKRWSTNSQLADGTWAPARPLLYWSLFQRLRACLGVFFGRYDALDWQ